MTLVAFDGTWNDEIPKPGKRPSNAKRFLDAYDSDPPIYKRGIGNDEDYPRFAQLVCGAFGLGGRNIVEEACMELGAKIEQGQSDIIDIVGFSRGSALALHFANIVALKGVPLPSTRKTERKLIPNLTGKGHRFKVTHHFTMRPVTVRWLGLWDTVPEIGIPGNDINLGYKLDLPKGTKGSHAMALDVSDSNFLLHRVDKAREVWFMGAHSEVGGGSGNERLADCTLRWMAGEARHLGVPVDLSRIKMKNPGKLGLPANDEVHEHSRRIVKPGDLVHRTVRKDDYPSIPWAKVRVV